MLIVGFMKDFNVSMKPEKSIFHSAENEGNGRYGGADGIFLFHGDGLSGR